MVGLTDADVSHSTDGGDGAPHPGRLEHPEAAPQLHPGLAGVQLYPETGRLTKGGVSGGSTSLESFLLHGSSQVTADVVQFDGDVCQTQIFPGVPDGWTGEGKRGPRKLLHLPPPPAEGHLLLLHSLHCPPLSASLSADVMHKTKSAVPEEALCVVIVSISCDSSCTCICQIA
ncbi:hypothetical protein OJAV_G00073940 [Oryzias javanicus]|uniref:Uncharacterized protein n=1 Tax=Oryzias javanicus TaxID=123683 RepID=A0A3S2MXK1_ORYJA|nr:hypothetical protein OJAV_G00073940 [Oryzias javanicus]